MCGSLARCPTGSPQWAPNGSVSCLLLWPPHTTHLLVSGSFGTLWGAEMLTLNSLKKKGLKRHFLPNPESPQQKHTYQLHMWSLQWQKQFTSPLALKIHPSSSDFSFNRSISLSVPFPSLSLWSLLLTHTLEPDECPLTTQSSWWCHMGF